MNILVEVSSKLNECTSLLVALKGLGLVLLEVATRLALVLCARSLNG